LFAARVGLGIGEAALAPAALSMISDYFPRESRGRAISVYNGGISIGIGIALIVGGGLVEYVGRTPSIMLPIFGETRAWQAVFIAVGLPGLLVAALVLAVPEPLRRGRLVGEGVAATTMSIGQVLRYFAAHARSFISHFLGMSVVTILGYAYFAWLPTAFVRSWHWTIAEIGFAYGVILLVFAPIGVVIGGWYADSLYRRGHKDAHMRATFLGALFFVPLQTAAPLMPDPYLVLAVLALATVSGSSVSATGIAALMMVVPNQMRGQATAMFYLVLSILGLTLGPSAVALVTDHIFHDEAALRYSIGLVCGFGGIFGVTLLGYNLKHYRALVRSVEGLR
jgi:MFS family permease